MSPSRIDRSSMDMEHHNHHHLLQLSPPAHLMMSPASFFDIGGGGGGFDVDVVPVVGLEDDGGGGGGWVEDLMQLGDELFGVGNGVDVDGAVGDHDQLRTWQQCEDGLSPDGLSPPSGELELACPDDGDQSPARKRRDRSKTIVSERKRRVRMKEKLYELRALVPNITKMDKASIIADAVVYVKNLQAHARKLKEDVAVLEVDARPMTRTTSSPAARRQAQQRDQQRRAAAASAPRRQAGRHGGNGAAAASKVALRPHGATVTHVGASRVGEGRFFVTVECERADGVAAPLCAAVESLSRFRVESSTLGCSTDRVVSTLTLKVDEATDDATISEGTVKLWVMAALLSEGFRPKSTDEISRPM